MGTYVDLARSAYGEYLKVMEPEIKSLEALSCIRLCHNRWEALPQLEKDAWTAAAKCVWSDAISGPD